MGTSELLGKPNLIAGDVISDVLASRPGEVEILLVASYYRNRVKLRQLFFSSTHFGFCAISRLVFSNFEK